MLRLASFAPSTKARMNISSAEIEKFKTITLKLVLKEIKEIDSKNNLEYKFVVAITNNHQRNVDLELLEIFEKIGASHLMFVSKSFESRAEKYGKSVTKFVNKTKGIFIMFGELLAGTNNNFNRFINTYESFIRPNDNKNIEFLKYDVKAAEDQLGIKLRCFKYASDVGRGFSLRSDVEFLRSIMGQIGANMDFIKKSLKDN